MLISTAVVPTAGQQSQPLDLNGVWTVNGVAVGIKQSAAGVTATFIGSPGCPISQFFSAQLSGVTPGSLMKGPITVCRDQAQVKMCPNGLSDSFSANMRATAQQNTINIEYEDEGIVVTRNRFTKKVTSCTPRPASSTGTLVLTRCSSGSSDCGCRQGNIEILRRVLQGKQVVKQAYENARDRGIGPTFQDVNDWIREQITSHDSLGFEEAGFPDVVGGGCTPPPWSQCSSIKVVPNCKPSLSGNQSLDKMCEQHELAHGADVQRAFQQLKRGEWTDKRFTDYLDGKSPRKEDTLREVNDEIARYQDDINFLNKEISRLQQQQKQQCP